MGVEESSSLLIGNWRSLDCMSRFGPSSCVGLAGVKGDIGAGAWAVFGLWGVAAMVCVDLGGCSGGAEGSGYGDWSALLVGSCEAAGFCERREGLAGV